MPNIDQKMAFLGLPGGRLGLGHAGTSSLADGTWGARKGAGTAGLSGLARWQVRRVANDGILQQEPFSGVMNTLGD